MNEINREYLAHELRELCAWADYLHLSLTSDRPFERGKVRLLESLAPREELEQLRFELSSARYRLLNLFENLNSASASREAVTARGDDPSPLPESPAGAVGGQG